MHVYVCMCMYVYIYICTRVHISRCTGGGRRAKRNESGRRPEGIPGGTKHATSVDMRLLRLQSSEGKLATSREVEPVRGSLCRRGGRTRTEVARFGAFWGMKTGGAGGGRSAQRQRLLPHKVGTPALALGGEVRLMITYSTLFYSTPLHSTPLHSTPLHSTLLHSTLVSLCLLLLL